MSDCAGIHENIRVLIFVWVQQSQTKSV